MNNVVKSMSGFKINEGPLDPHIQQPTTQFPLKIADNSSTQGNQQQAWAVKTESNGFMRLNPYDIC